MADKTAELALMFVNLLAHEMEDEQWAEMRAKNGTGEYKLACASHDYLDANMVMAAAFKAVHDRDPAFSDEAHAEADIDAWNAAWTLARQTVLTDKPTMSERQRDLARHALGLKEGRGRWPKSYRNHFVASEGHTDWPDWMLLHLAGLAKRRDGGPISGGDEVFWLKRAGAEMALNPNERLDPEDFPPSA